MLKGSGELADEEAALCLDKAEPRPEAPPSKLVWLVMLTLGIVCTSLLVLCNKTILNRGPDVAGKASLLTFFHAITGMVFWKLMFVASGEVLPSIPGLHQKLMVTSSIAVTSMLTGHLTLQASSVGFYQLSRLLALPVGATFDYAIRGKTRTFGDAMCLVVLAGAVFGGITADMTITLPGVWFAIVHNITSIACAAMIRKLNDEQRLDTAALAAYLAPYNVAVSLGCLIFNSDWKQMRTIELSQFTDDNYSIIFVVNLVLALSVSFLSTWASGKCSQLLYAVLANSKTIVTIVLSLLILGEAISLEMFSALVVCVVVIIKLTTNDTTP